MKTGLVGPSYQEASLPFDAQRSINLYAVKNESKTDSSTAMYGTPGLTLFSGISTNAIRGIFTSANGRCFVVSGTTIYELFSDGTTSNLGTLLTSGSIVSFDESPTQLCLCDGTSLYILTYTTNAFARVTTANLPAVGSVTFSDGFFVATAVGTGAFYKSAIYDGFTWAALDYATAESSPDNLTKVINASGQLWLFGDRTTEIWINTGGSKFPYQRISGGAMAVGVLAPNTVLSLDNSVFWVGKDKNGAGMVFRANGFSPQRISTSFIERVIQAAPDIVSLRSYSYQRNGKVFYIVTGGGLGTTLAYDLTTGWWHERAYLNSLGNFEQHLGCCGAYAFNKFLVGDRKTGNIYVLNEDSYTDNGDVLCRERIFTHLGDEQKRIRYNTLVIDMEVGVGNLSAPGVNPLISLQLSKDGAKTWSNWITTSVGATGNYDKNVEFRRLGIAQQMTFRIRITDPVKVALYGGYLK